MLQSVLERSGVRAVIEMTDADIEQEQENERNNGCCECGQRGHGCNDCPTFGGPGS